MSEQYFKSDKNLTNINSVQGNVIFSQNTYYYQGCENPASSSPDNESNETDKNKKRSARRVNINQEFAESGESEKSFINSSGKKRWFIALIFALGFTATVFKWNEKNASKDGILNDSSNLNKTNIYQEASSDTPKNVVTTRNSSRTIELKDDRIEEIADASQSTITYETTSWTVDKNELTIVYRDYDSLTYTAKFNLENSGGDLRYIIRRIPANTRMNLPDGWMLDTVRDAVIISDVSKTRSLGSKAVIISGPNTIITKTHDVQFTARYMGIAIENYATTDWSERNGILTVSYEGSDGSKMLSKTLTFNKKSTGGDNYYVISSGLPAHTRINLPKGWTLDTMKNAVDVSDQSKIMPIDKIAINIAGANVVVTKYSNVPFTVRHSD